MRSITQKIGLKAEELRQRLGVKGEVIWALITVSWGVASGISLKRDYAHSSALVGYLLVFLGISIASRVWLDLHHKHLSLKEPKNPILGALTAQKGLVDKSADFASQYAVQYILMFCLPLLFMAKAWILFGVALILVGLILVDRFWRWLVNLPFAAPLIRAFTTGLATAYAFPVFFPQFLKFYSIAVASASIAGALPWSAFLDSRWPNIRDLLPCLMLGMGAFFSNAREIPLLSIWLTDPALGVNIVGRELETRWPSIISQDTWLASREGSSSVCCLSPVVAPSGVEAAMSHEWVVNGRVVDRIEIPPIRSIAKNGEKAFRTYSCKRYFDDPAAIRKLECRIYLNQTLYLGHVNLDVLEHAETALW